MRYFINTARTATLRVATCSYSVCEVSLQSGVLATLSPAERAQAQSSHFDIAEGFGKWHKLALGSTKQDVLTNLGEPARKSGDDSWVYDSQCACELPEYMTLVFSQQKVMRVVLSAPAD